jgi:hypothetical protein
MFLLATLFGQVEVHHGAVEPVSTALPGAQGITAASALEDVQVRITALRPFSMSWSNVLDYIEPCAFHTMARACSAPNGTVHCGYSINWPRQVKGASV